VDAFLLRRRAPARTIRFHLHPDMIDSAPSVILSCEGFAGRVQLTRYAEQKAARLLRQAHPHPHRICVHVRLDPDSRQPSFIACATIEKDSVIHVAHATAEDPQPAVSSALAGSNAICWAMPRRVGPPPAAGADHRLPQDLAPRGAEAASRGRQPRLRISR